MNTSAADFHYDHLLKRFFSYWKTKTQNVRKLKHNIELAESHYEYVSMKKVVFSYDYSIPCINLHL